MTEGPRAAYPKARRHRVLVAAAVVSPLVVGGGAAVLVVHSLAHSWLWGVAGLAVVLTLFALVTIALVLYARRNPDAAQAYIAAYGRAKGGARPS